MMATISGLDVLATIGGLVLLLIVGLGWVVWDASVKMKRIAEGADNPYDDDLVVMNEKEPLDD